MTRLLSTWAPRIALGLLLYTTTDLLLGRSNLRGDALDVIASIAGFMALGALVLDLMERYAVRDMFALLAVCGVCGLGAFVLVDTRISTDAFLAIAARALGANTVSAMLAVGALLWLAGPAARTWTLWALLPYGVLAGVWLRWTPYSGIAPQEADLWALGLAAAFTLSASLFGRLRSGGMRTDLRLTLPDAFMTAGLVVIGLTGQSDSRLPEPLTGVILASLAAVCIVMLWFQRRLKTNTYLDGIRTPSRLTLAHLFPFLLIVVGVAIGVRLMRGEGASDPVAVGGTLFTAFGFVWLPTVALVYGWRALRRDVRAMRI